MEPEAESEPQLEPITPPASEAEAEAEGEVPPKPAFSDDPGLNPQNRARLSDLTGIPVVLGDGKTWLLPRPVLYCEIAKLRDDIFFEWMNGRDYSEENFLNVGYWLLDINYNLVDFERFRLINEIPKENFADFCLAVIEAVIPHAKVKGFEYTEYLATAVLSAGLDPETVHPDYLPGLIKHLEESKRIAPLSAFVDSAKEISKRNYLRGMVKK